MDNFLNQLNQCKNQLEELFDFEKVIISQSNNDDEKIATQIKGLRLLMKSIIINIQKENNLNNLPLLI